MLSWLDFSTIEKYSNTGYSKDIVESALTAFLNIPLSEEAWRHSMLGYSFIWLILKGVYTFGNYPIIEL